MRIAYSRCKFCGLARAASYGLCEACGEVIRKSERREETHIRKTALDIVRELHSQAIELAEKGDAGERGHYEQAAAFADQAATAWADAGGVEPTRSILYRLAASLAIQCGYHERAETLICRGLLGEPPTEIARELRSLWLTIHARLNLDSTG